MDRRPGASWKELPPTPKQNARQFPRELFASGNLTIWLLNTRDCVTSARLVQTDRRPGASRKEFPNTKNQFPCKCAFRLRYLHILVTKHTKHYDCCSLLSKMCSSSGVSFAFCQHLKMSPANRSFARTVPVVMELSGWPPAGGPEQRRQFQ